MSLEPLDRIDRKVLALLQEDGRMTNKDLSEHLGLSPASTLERVRKLEAAGYIEGYAALVNAALVERGTAAFVGVTMKEHGAASIERFMKHVAELPDVLESYHVSGEMDLLLKVAVKDIAAFEDFLLHKLTTMPDVARVQTSFVFSTVKHRTPVPIAALDDDANLQVI